jgi:hypothetical protein
MRANKKGLQLLGAAFLTQAVTSLIGGAVFFNTYVAEGNITATMGNIAANIGGVYAGIILQIVTALVIIVLGAALYQTVCHVSKTAAVIALLLYVSEALTLLISQLFVFALTEASRQLVSINDTALIRIGSVLIATKSFAENINMLPFGIGAILFYFLLLKAGTIPKWLALWGLLAVPFVMVSWSLVAFGVAVPFVLSLPYVPWEFFTGAFILIKVSRKSSMQ